VRPKHSPEILGLLKSGFPRGCIFYEINPGSSTDPKERHAYREIKRICEEQGVNSVPELYVVGTDPSYAISKQYTLPYVWVLKLKVGKNAPSAIIMTEQMIEQFDKQAITASIEHEVSHIGRGHQDKLVQLAKWNDNKQYGLIRINSLKKRQELQADEGVSNPKAFVGALEDIKTALTKLIKDGLRECDNCSEQQLEIKAKQRVRTLMGKDHPSDHVRYKHLFTHRKDETDRSR